MTDLKTINLKELKQQVIDQKLENILNGLQSLKEYIEYTWTSDNRRDIRVVSSYNDILEVCNEDGEKIRMNYDEKVISTNGELVEAVFLNDSYKLIIFNPFNSKQVDYKLVEVNAEQTKENRFIKMLNKGWLEAVEENKFQILLSSKGQNETIEKFKNLIFHEMKFKRYYEGTYHRAYLVTEYELTISLNGVQAYIGAAPGFNGDSSDSERNWYLNSYLEYHDSLEGKIQIADGDEWSEIFSLSDEQVKSFSELLNNYELLEKSEKEYDVRLIKHLQERIKALQAIMPPGLIVQIRVVDSGFKLEYIEKDTGKLINSIATFEEQLNM